MPRLRKTQAERSDETRRRLLAATVDLILERGLAGATLNEICRRAGVTTGALQHHFGSRSELLIATTAELFAPFAEKFPSTVNPTDTPLESRISGLLDRYWKIYADRSYLAILEIVSSTRHDSALRVAASKYRDLQVANLAKHLASEFPDVDIPADRMLESTRFVVDSMRGGAIRMIFEPSRKAREAIRGKAHEILLAEFSAHQ